MATNATDEINKRPTTANEIGRDMRVPRLGGLTATKFKNKYGMSKKTAKLISPKTATQMNRGGMTMRKGNMAYNKGGYAKCGASYKG